MTFIFDTGSAWTWLPNNDCPKTECTKNIYDYSRSTAYDKTEDEAEVTYGIGYIKGTVVNDDIAIENNQKSAARDVNFLSVFHANQLDTIESDGLLGLSPKVIRQEKNMHLLVDQLKVDGVISKAIFAMYLADEA